MLDAVVVGSGPNGLAAAIALARAGRSVVVLEAGATVGGGMRSGELTLPGFTHDICSSIHPFGVASPFFATLPLAEHGLEWCHPEVPVAHPFDDGSAAVLHRSVAATAEGLGGRDGRAWRRLVGPLEKSWDDLGASILGPLLRFPAHPLTLARFGARAVWPATMLAKAAFRGDHARGLFAGLAAHAILDLGRPLTASFAVTFAAASKLGWPAARGGSQRIADALVGYLESLGGEVRTGHHVSSLADLPAHRAVLFDLSPGQVLDIVGDRMAGGRRRRLRRFRHGPGAFKVDYALSDVVPWTAEECHRAGVVHVGGTVGEVAVSERAMARGVESERPFLICVQASRFDPTRAPEGRHTMWAYCHVPPGSTTDMTSVIEAQIERFAPGFGGRVLARHVTGPADLERENPNYVGGDIAGGSHGGLQLLARPVLSTDPYRLPVKGEAAFLCSASTPPGAGVHGMCGWWAANSALERLD